MENIAFNDLICNVVYKVSTILVQASLCQVGIKGSHPLYGCQ